MTALLHYLLVILAPLFTRALSCSLSATQTSTLQSPSLKKNKRGGFLRYVFHVYSRRDSPRALCVSNWSHAAVACTGGGIRAGGVFFDLILSNRHSSWAEPRAPGANRRRCRERTGLVSACWLHVSWNSYCTPGGNVLKRSSRLKKRHTHVFCGLQGNWKSHAALPDYYREARLCSNRDGQSSEMVILSRITRVIFNGLLV